MPYQPSRADIFARLVEEYNAALANCGYVFFITLTFQDDFTKVINLPHGKYVRLFEHRYVRNYIHNHLQLKLKDYNMKYYVFSELGLGKGKRKFEFNPHYHCLFFLSPRKEELKEHRAECINFIQNTLSSSWSLGSRDSLKYGITSYGRDGCLVTSVDALRYCSKYCTKGIHVHSLVSYFKNTAYDLDNSYYDVYKKHFPKTFHSNNFGKSILSRVVYKNDRPYVFSDDKFIPLTGLTYRWYYYVITYKDGQTYYRPNKTYIEDKLKSFESHLQRLHLQVGDFLKEIRYSFRNSDQRALFDYFLIFQFHTLPLDFTLDQTKELLSIKLWREPFDTRTYYPICESPLFRTDFGLFSYLACYFDLWRTRQFDEKSFDLRYSLYIASVLEHLKPYNLSCALNTNT